MPHITSQKEILILRTEGRMPWRALIKILPNNEQKEWDNHDK